MGDEDAFLRAIVAAPDDDAPRLVYADWLDERGDAGRAEFLRADAELRHVETRNPHYPDVQERWVRARDAVPAEWLDTLGPRVTGLPLPASLADLLTRDRWGGKTQHGYDVGFDCPSWHLCPYTVSQMQGETAHVCGYLRWLGMADPDQLPGDIDPRLTVLIGDEGIGSDSPFALDYRASFGRPRVLLLRWQHDWQPGSCRWVEIAPDFPTFLRLSFGRHDVA